MQYPLDLFETFGVSLFGELLHLDFRGILQIKLNLGKTMKNSPHLFRKQVLLVWKLKHHSLFGRMCSV